MKLTTDQERILTTLAKEKIAQRFYWTGGTLLSHYYLHHRKSFDLDFFTDTAFRRDDLTPFLSSLKTTLNTHVLEEKKIYDRWEFVFPDRNPPVRFEFVHYNHEKIRLAPLDSYRGILIDSLPDLAANKVMAYLDRNQPKDLFDIYALLTKRKFTVDELIRLLEKKFGVRISEFTFWTESAKSLKQLETLRPYVLEADRKKQNAVLTDIRSFFLDGGASYLRQTLA